MKIDEIKKKILQLAIQGKLVEQSIEDRESKHIVEECRKIKKKLLEDKVIRKEKPVPKILDFELPFDIPENWTWVRLGDLVTYKNGYAYKSTDMSKIKKGYPVIKSGNIMSLKVDINAKTDYIDEPTPKMLDSSIQKGDLLMCLSSQSDNLEPLGKTAIYDFDTPALLNQRVLKIRTLVEETTKYIYYVINSPYFHYTVSHQGGGSAQANLKMDHVLYMLVPIPPLEEQKRIVARVDELFAIVDELNGNKTEIAKCIADARNKILQLAIQGKLVKQDSKDEPASMLLEKIREEKEKLIKEKKIKKEKPLPEVREEEKAFEIPKGWEWCRLGDLIQLNPRNKVSDDTEVSFIPMALFKDGYSCIHDTETRVWKDIKTGFTHFANNDVVIAKITPCFENRKSAILTNLANGVGAGTTELYVLRILGNTIESKFLYNIIVGQDFIDRGKATYTGTAGQQRVKKDFIVNYVVALPPLEEQKRIVAKIDKLMAYLDNLEKAILE